MTLPTRVALGTMHGKEAALAPPLAGLGIKVVLARIDTDRFGTFTAETPRAGSMEEAARAKALAAMKATGLDVGIGSEGAYGPHPYLPFAGIGQEVLLWHEAATGREIVVRVMDAKPVYDHCDAANLPEAEDFLLRVGFPACAVIVAPSPTAPPVAKGLRQREALGAALQEAVALSDRGRAFLQTDMRAHLNPRRMAMIGQGGEKLVKRLVTPCPACGMHGWGVIRHQPGLPCEACGGDTALIAADILGCSACGEEQAKRREGLAAALYCPICNP
jgi:hypothetical protein